MMSNVFIVVGYSALIAQVGWYGVGAIALHILIMVIVTRKSHHV